MQNISVTVIRKLLQGVLVSGSEQWFVKHAIYYNRHDLTQKNTLMFINKSESINWKEIDHKGPSLVISDKPLSELKNALANTTVIQVKSTLQAYWKFIEYYRGLFDIPVVALTGTCGKTTTKEMIKHIASKDWNVQASISSKNEPRQSLPYLTGIDKTTKAAVFELGLGNTGNIKHQCMIYKPTIGIITNIGVHHLDGCKNLEGYIKAKSEILEGLSEDGTLIINGDDENTKKVPLHTFKGKIITIGVQKQADYKASNIEFTNNGMKFTLQLLNEKYTIFVPGYGEHQVYNALAAIAAIKEMGLSIETAISRLKTFKPMARHLEFSTGIGESTIIDDTWTNNPTSVEAALKVLDTIGKDKKIILILGDIKRLGLFEEKYHREIGSMVAQRNIEMLMTIGKRAEDIAAQAKKDGTTAEVHIFKDVTGVLEILKPKLDKDTIVLIKGPMSSRSMIEFANQLKQI
ncbi:MULTISPECIES: UDP-N-acetylmuramoyl-tripeptide--D-alanyl-D-alanine ligase [unclassified Lysinibacillus]|uniref:UDP-N-acetylmuramoyl-tripeptide--D-alanyl-D- alanine ligase n=1 Tax=unclassified Lysinibacillus TaxID=2636778 RepID=UPI00116C6E5B|nr:UDP-N-acetylmuramoyl-tripeptide--D-alanyl-D-alanine ligase [Lysinibacillus sp. CD3-6]QPQ36112.1 UDP-N-acetylmuramoyl-tripeptide--D-alanyl-D-alanine ligase [Lysinibacillus sp. JNUCC-52]UED82232.1 UDP-N-acetylmuramoyl-tripeptide--D-alanyl-D-alanine ligase [Lysinibacillus sp. CD3-6]